MGSILTIDDVRHFMMDRTVQDNEIDLELLFDDVMIKKAMEYAVKTYNSIPPFCEQGISPDRIPFIDDTFLYGVAYHLYLMLIQKGIKNELPYTAGGTGVDIDNKRIQQYKEQAQNMRAEFVDKATKIKHAKNIRQAWAMW